MKIFVEIPEIHKVIVEVNVPDGSSREKMIDAAQEAFNNADELPSEYSDTLEHDKWTIRDKNGHYFGEKNFG